MREFINNVKIVVYLLRRYGVRLVFTPLIKHRQDPGSCAVGWTTREKLGKLTLIRIKYIKIYVPWWEMQNPFITFLHEMGHATTMKRFLLHKIDFSKLKDDRLYDERRASIWAVRVSKLINNHKSPEHLLDSWYGTYVAAYCKNDPIKLANESYKAVKAFGVKYE